MKFVKYQGAGNDFVLIDNRKGDFPVIGSKNEIQKICNRHFGIGADGLILLETDSKYDFKMVYYNSDGRESTMCGNGGRCIVAFARDIGLIVNACRFLAIDGTHEALIRKDWVELKMIDVSGITRIGKDFFIETGSPHYIRIMNSITELEQLDVRTTGAAIRNGDIFGPRGGTNVNFISFEKDHIAMRTFERGVEDETLACGTGVTAVAILAAHLAKSTGNQMSKVKTLGAELEVSYEQLSDSKFTQVWLKGPAKKVFEGVIEL
ncbi:MAG: diaminopimelate epimerase [Flavobacteriales bacterium]|nr:diaminopimelate epimerase [Flavobacteriales bacterium]